ncbi:MAG: glycosyltransferase [Nitriliruptoraceae bacterium]
MDRVALLSVHTSPLDQPGTGDGGGLNVYVREVAAGLARQGVEVDVFTRRSDPDVPPEVSLTDGVSVHHVDAGPAAPIGKGELANHLCAFVLAMQRHPRVGMHDVLHANYWLSGWVARRLSRVLGTAFVHTFHTLGVLKNATLAPGDVPEPALRLVAEERIARDADRILVLTCGEARLLHRAYGLSGRSMTVVPPGVDLDRFAPAGDGSTGSSGARLLFVGRLQPLKGPDVAIRTLAEVRRSRPDATLEIVGGESGESAGVDPGSLRRLAEVLGVSEAVTIGPAVPQSQLADRYRAADVVLAPSRSETFGLVALEAQASGVPVVAARVAGLESVVGAGGTLVDGHDPQDHARAVLGYLDDRIQARSARRAGIEAARGATWDATVQRLLAAYADVLGTATDAGEPEAREDVAAGPEVATALAG